MSCFSTGMSPLTVDPSSQKRKRQGTQPLYPIRNAEETILGLIKSGEELGMLLNEIMKETKVPEKMCTKILKALVGKSLIKQVPTLTHNKKGVVYMAAEFEPSKELSGGVWYDENGKLDKTFIEKLGDVCKELIERHKVLTLDMAYLIVKEIEVVTVEIAKQQIGEILTSLVLDNEILEVKSTGRGDYSKIPRGTSCYRVGAKEDSPNKQLAGRFASIPCGACPRIGYCSSDGIISPTTCEYYTKWLDIEF